MHLPRLVNLEWPHEQAHPELTMEALRIGSIGESQSDLCSPTSCVGSFDPVSVGHRPSDVPAPNKPARLVRLREGQGVIALLRFVPANEPKGLHLDEKEAFTAIVRYRSGATTPSAKVEVAGEGGAWQLVQAKWKATDKFQWLQVYPVYPFPDGEHSADKIALKIRISGVGEGREAPEVDAAGFVPGKPWCLEKGDSFATVCPSRDGGAYSIRRAPGAPTAVPKPK